MAYPETLPPSNRTVGSSDPPGDNNLHVVATGNIDARLHAVELFPPGVFTNVRIAGNCAGNGTTDDSAKIQAVIDASSVGDTLYFDRLFGVGALNGGYYGVRLKAERHYLGSNPVSAGFRAINGANLNVIACDEGWYNNGTVASNPVAISNMAFKGNSANQTSGNGHGCILFNFWSRVFNCHYEDARGDNQILTIVNRAGTQISNVISDPAGITATSGNAAASTSGRSTRRS
jgi:hypothetical protein